MAAQFFKPHRIAKIANECDKVTDQILSQLGIALIVYDQYARTSLVSEVSDYVIGKGYDKVDCAELVKFLSTAIKPSSGDTLAGLPAKADAAVTAMQDNDVNVAVEAPKAGF